MLAQRLKMEGSRKTEVYKQTTQHPLDKIFYAIVDILNLNFDVYLLRRVLEE